jgi:hypothetical protein
MGQGWPMLGINHGPHRSKHHGPYRSQFAVNGEPRGQPPFGSAADWSRSAWSLAFWTLEWVLLRGVRPPSTNTQADDHDRWRSGSHERPELVTTEPGRVQGAARRLCARASRRANRRAVSHARLVIDLMHPDRPGGRLGPRVRWPATPPTLRGTA